MNENQTLRLVIDILEGNQSASQFKGFGVCKNLRGYHEVAKGSLRLDEWKSGDQQLYSLYERVFDLLETRLNSSSLDLSAQLCKIVDTQFFTPELICDSLAQTLLLKADNQEKLKILEPSAGMGNFVDALLKYSDQELEIDLVEKDEITAYFLKLKYGSDPRIKVMNLGYEELAYDKNYDIILSNIPFGNMNLSDAKNDKLDIESFYFKKSHDLLKEAGICSFITSTGFLYRERGETTRKYLAENSNIIEAGFFPQEMFEGTFVSSNLVVFQKSKLRENDLKIDKVYEVKFRPNEKEYANASLSLPMNACLMETSETDIDIAKRDNFGVRGYGLDIGKRTDYKDVLTNRPFGNWDLHFHYNNLDSIALDLSKKLSESLTKRQIRTIVRSELTPFETSPIRQKPVFKPITLLPVQLSIFDAPKSIEELLDYETILGQKNIKLRFLVSQKHNDNNLFFFIVQNTDDYSYTVVNQLNNEGIEDALYAKLVYSRKDSKGRWTFAMSDWSENILTSIIESYCQQIDMRGAQIYTSNGMGQHIEFNNYILQPAQSLKEVVEFPTYVRKEEVSNLSGVAKVKFDYLLDFYKLYLELEKDPSNIDLKKKLILQYESLTEAYDKLNHGRGLKQVIKKTFQPSAQADLLSLELVIGDKIVRSHYLENERSQAVFVPKNVREDFYYQKYKHGQFNLAATAKHFELTESEVYDQLKDKIIQGNYSKVYVIKEDLLRGNLRDNLKLHQDPNIKEFIHANLPASIQFKDINFTFGNRWMETELYERFLNKLFYTGPSTQIKLKLIKEDYFLSYSDMVYDANRKWSVSSEGRSLNGYDFLDRMFKGTRPPFSYTQMVGDKKVTYIDKQAIAIFEQKKLEFTKLYESFLNNLAEEEKEAIEQRYNYLFNSNIKHQYDEDTSVYTEDMQLENLKNVKSLKPHQIDGASFALRNGGGLLDHEVGTGKTYQICLLAHEMVRRDKARRVVIVLPNPNIAEIVATYKKIYPSDKILYPSTEDFGERNRETFIKRIDKSDHSVIFLNYNQFQCIPIDSRVMEDYYQERIDNLSTAIYEMERESGGDFDKNFIKRLQKRLERYEDKLKDTQANLRKNQIPGYDLDRLRIDHIIVDECHNFKNIPFETAHTNVKGLNTQEGSDRASALHMATLDIQNRLPDTMGVTLFSGTPISNSVCEIYNWARLLVPNSLAQKCISSFDSFANTFFDKTYDIEVTMTGMDMEEKERFRDIKNVPELAKLYQSFSHIIRAEDIGIERPIPKAINVKIKPDAAMESHLLKLEDFIKTGTMDIDGKSFSMTSTKSKMLEATNFMRQLTTDVRLLNPEARLDKTKLDYVVDQVYKEYELTSQNKGTQIIFLDKGVPGSTAAKINLYDDIRDKLKRLGMNESEIAYIHHAKTDKQKDKLYEQMNQGEIRVLIASRAKGGVGINVQRLGSAIHFVDIMWTPLLDEQSRGRFIRQGNEFAPKYANNEVKIFKYGYEKSGDLRMLSTNESKERIINIMRSSSTSLRNLSEGDGDEETGIGQGDFLADLMADNRMAQKIKLEKQIIRLSARIDANYNEYASNKRKLKFSQSNLEKYLKELSVLELLAEEKKKHGFKYDDGLFTFSENLKKEELLAKGKPIFESEAQEVEPKELKKSHIGEFIKFVILQQIDKIRDEKPVVIGSIGEQINLVVDKDHLFVQATIANDVQELTICPKDTLAELMQRDGLHWLGAKPQDFVDNIESNLSSCEKRIEVYQREIEYCQNFMDNFDLDKEREELYTLQTELKELKASIMQDQKNKDNEDRKEIEL